MDISIIVPTKNRHYFCKRLIRYYISQNFSGEIFILDGSDKEDAEKNSTFIKNLNKKNIRYFYGQGTAFVIQKEIVDLVEKNFMVYCGDDDYFILNGLQSCIDFLNTNPNYVAVNGKCFNLACDGPNSEIIKEVIPYKQTTRLEKNCSERVKLLLREYDVPVFSVMKKKTYKKMLNHIPSQSNIHVCPDKIFCDEMLPALALAAYGQIYSVSELHLVRTLHNPKYYKAATAIPFSDWLSDKKFEISYNYFKNQIARIISFKENTSLLKAENIVDEAFQFHVKITKLRMFKNRLKKKLFFPYKFIKTQIIKRRNATIRGFIKNNTFTYDDIVPVYESITKAVYNSKIN